MSTSKRLEWTPEKILNIRLALKDIRNCQNRGELLPQKVFEALLPTYKKISTEAAIIRGGAHDGGFIYLVERPSLKENPYEPYPEAWCFPGVLHRLNESFEESCARLYNDEISGIDNFLKIEELATVEAIYPFRGLIQMRVLRIWLHQGDIPQNPRGQFFSFKKLPSNLLEIQREVLIPHVRPYYQ